MKNKIMMCPSNKPVINGSGKGVWRRVKIFPETPFEFKPKEKTIKKLIKLGEKL